MTIKKWTFKIGFLLSALLYSNASASGFALIEESVSAMGNAYAGAGTSAYDASILYFNPAGITKICGNQAVAGVHFVIPSSKYHNKEAYPYLSPNTPMTGGDGGDAGKFAPVGNLYAVSNCNNRIFYGIGVNSPFGLETVYDGDWVGRYYSLKSAILSININPTIAYRINDCLSIGAGFSAMYFHAKLTNAVDFGSILYALTHNPNIGVPQGADGNAKLTGDSWGWGGNVGLLWDMTPCTRVGLSYRSQVRQHVRGKIEYGNVPALLLEAGQFENVDADAVIILPDLVTLSAFHYLSNCLAVMADVSWTHWELLPALIVKTQGDPAEITTTLKWKNTWRAALGATYFYNECASLRAGFAWDQSPTPNKELRSPRIPDQDRYWITVGAGYWWNNCLRFDFAYAHLFTPTARIDTSGFNTNPLLPDNQELLFKGALVGKWDQYVDIVSVQAVWDF